MSRTFLPPERGGLLITFAASCGGESEFHVKVLILFVRCFLMFRGIPWAVVMNWVMPPIIIWIMCFLPSMEGYAFSHVWRLFSILSIMLGQGSVPLWLFPI